MSSSLGAWNACVSALEAQQRLQDAKRAKLRDAVDEGKASGIFEGDPFASVRAGLGLHPRR